MGKLTLIALLAVSGVAAADAWAPYRSSAGHYTAEFPGTPKESRFNAGHAYGTLALLKQRNATYGVTAFELEDKGRKDPAAALEEIRHLAKSVHVAVTPVSVNGHEGLEARTTENGLTALHRLYILDHREYHVFALAPAGKETVRDMMKFLDSFAIDD
jgi:hypothetical protein